MANEILIEWEAIEYGHKTRDRDWHWALGILGGAITLVLVLFDNALFGVVVAIATATMILLSSRPAEPMRITITDRGIRIRNELYLFANIKSFWIDEDAPEPSLTLPVNRSVFPHIKLSLRGVNALSVQNILLAYLKEEYQEPTLAERISNSFGF